MHSQNNPGYSSQSPGIDGYYTGEAPAPSGGYYAQQQSYQASTMTSIHQPGPGHMQTQYSFFALPRSHSVTHSSQHRDVYPGEICCRII